jgi:hypothetical protein
MWLEIASFALDLAEYPRPPNTMAMIAPTANQTRNITLLRSVESGHAGPATHSAVIIGLRCGYHGGIRIQETLTGVLPLMTDLVMAFGIRDPRGRAGHQRSPKQCKNDITHSSSPYFLIQRCQSLNLFQEVRPRAAVDSAAGTTPITMSIN